MSACAIGMGSPSWRERCTVRATSSVMTAALTAAFASRPMVKTPWFCMSTAGERESLSVATTPCPMESSPISANGPTGAHGDGPAELVGHRREDAGDLLAPRGPGGGVRAVRVHLPADLGHVP